MKKLKYKFLRSGLKSESGNLKWKIGKWNHISGELDICYRGLHCSAYPDQAFSFVQGEILALVETKGKSIVQDDKECWSDMRITSAYHWTKKDSVELAIYAAELVIGIYEKKYPNDDRPRKSIEAAKYWIKHPRKKSAKAASYASYSSAYAASHSSYAAYAAAYAAYAAAKAAAYAAYAAAKAAAYAASYSSAYASYSREVNVLKIRKWMLMRIKKLENIV